MNITELLTRMKLTHSGSTARRAVVVGGVKLNGQDVSLDMELSPKVGDVVSFGGGKYIVTEKDLDDAVS